MLPILVDPNHGDVGGTQIVFGQIVQGRAFLPIVQVPDLTRRHGIKLNTGRRLRAQHQPLGCEIRTLLDPLGEAGGPTYSARRLRSSIGMSNGMRKLLLIVVGVCFWVVLLAAIITTVARLSTEKERRSQAVAAHLSKTKR
ncbi:hypothetical protein L6654_41265 [Bradyrhizobium sp. WYCCWR 13023]|uniref:Uncharacterized protein n=1 Tax=Bradyrhizobium zhengyangense TaxID=2911009 RepID=A0A9X1RJ57_9BRAD|nr:hypothetical protein [Bradyrhizobium zhengyangense]MCG2632996.1 hypothetical protein [Bradyrhizobium zhengyangense]